MVLATEEVLNADTSRADISVLGTWSPHTPRQHTYPTFQSRNSGAFCPAAPIQSPSPTDRTRCRPCLSRTFRGCCHSWLSPRPQTLALRLVMGSPAPARSSDLPSVPLGGFQGFGKESLRSLALAPENPLLVPPRSPRFPKLALGCSLTAASGCALAGLAWPGLAERLSPGFPSSKTHWLEEPSTSDSEQLLGDPLRASTQRAGFSVCLCQAVNVLVSSACLSCWPWAPDRNYCVTQDCVLAPRTGRRLRQTECSVSGPRLLRSWKTNTMLFLFLFIFEFPT